MALKVQVDLGLCQGHSVCMAEAPEVFEVVDVDGGYPQVRVLQERPAEELRDKLMAAGRYCPNHVITIIED